MRASVGADPPPPGPFTHIAIVGTGTEQTMQIAHERDRCHYR